MNPKAPRVLRASPACSSRDTSPCSDGGGPRRGAEGCWSLAQHAHLETQSVFPSRDSSPYHGLCEQGRVAVAIKTRRTRARRCTTQTFETQATHCKLRPRQPAAVNRPKQTLLPTLLTKVVSRTTHTPGMYNGHESPPSEDKRSLPSDTGYISLATRQTPRTKDTAVTETRDTSYAAVHLSLTTRHTPRTGASPAGKLDTTDEGSPELNAHNLRGREKNEIGGPRDTRSISQTT